MPGRKGITHYYPSAGEREAGIDAGEASRRRSTVSGDGHKHFAVVEYTDAGDASIVNNLTGTDQDDLRTAEGLAQNRNHGPFSEDVAGYAAERIA
jgi:hypothetical protein